MPEIPQMWPACRGGDKTEMEKTDHQKPSCPTAALTCLVMATGLWEHQSQLSDFLRESGNNVYSTLQGQGQERSARNQTHGSTDGNSTLMSSKSVQLVYIWKGNFYALSLKWLDMLLTPDNTGINKDFLKCQCVNLSYLSKIMHL